MRKRPSLPAHATHKPKRETRNSTEKRRAPTKARARQRSSSAPDSPSSAAPRGRGRSRSTTPTPKAPRKRMRRNPSARRRCEPPRRRSRVRLRAVRPGAVWLITKKTNDDLFHLRPDGAVNEVLLYTLLLKLKRYELHLHGYVFMSNHFHLVVTDVRGQLPAFMREFLSESGKALKVALGTTRRIWCADRYGATELLDRDAIERALVYLRVNPTNAGLTLPTEWPGLTSCHHRYGEVIEARRADFYFDAHTRPDLVRITLEPVPENAGRLQGLDSGGSTVGGERDSAHNVEQDEARGGTAQARATSTRPPPGVGKNTRRRRLCTAFEKRIARRAEREVARILQQRKSPRSGSPSKLAGTRAVLTASRSQRGNHHYGRLNPRYMSEDHERMQRAIEEHRDFLARHEEAKQRYASGEVRVLFPYGTYGYRERFGVRVARGGEAA